MRASSFPALLSDQLRADGARPLVTFYDDATGERIELSVTTFSNWVSKTAGLVQDELEVERGGLVLVDLPTHWLGVVWLGAAWTAGLCVTTDREHAADADLVVCGPDGLESYAGQVGDRPVVAISLRPLGARFADPIPTGVTDYGAVVLAQPDTFVCDDPPSADDLAWRDGERALSQRELLSRVGESPLVDAHGRLLTDVNPCSEQGLATLISPLLETGAAVWVANPDASSWDRKYADERATAQLLRS